MATVGQTTGLGTEAAVKAEEKATQEKEAAVAGAQAVADAVSKVANAAVDAAKGAPVEGANLDFVITGNPGGKFEARAKSGPIFSTSGGIFLNGKRLETYEWGADYIRGRLDADATSGVVTVPIDEKTVRRGYLKV